jgi:outer membrane receptor for Fe3+-dicitrate
VKLKNKHRPRRSGLAKTSAGLRVGALNAVAAAVAGILYCAGGAYAADETAPAASAAEVTGLDEIVVTASAQAVKKLDASFNIVSVSLQDIKMANPSSAAELYKLSPGVWPEASGGQTGVNIDVVGFPNGGGDSPYFTTMIQGSPLYGAPYLSFMDNSSLIRLDDTIERVEIVQGGTGRHGKLYSADRLGQNHRFGRRHLGQ